MNYSEFKDQFVADVKAKLSEMGADAEVTVNEVKKMNDSYEAITVTPAGSNIGANININAAYAALEDGVTYEDVLDKWVEIINNGLIANKPNFNVSEITNYSVMKDRLAIQVVSAEVNKELLETVPHQVLEDMAVVYRFVLSTGENGNASCLVSNQMLETMGVTPEQLFADAAEIAPKKNPTEIKGMSQLMAEMMGPETAQMLGIALVDPEDEMMFVASNPNKLNGAAVLTYPGFLEQAAEQLGGDFYVLPSSIHEIILLPERGDMCPRELENMVQEVNATQVAPEDKLSDNVYHYDSEAKAFELAEKYLARKAA